MSPVWLFCSSYEAFLLLLLPLRVPNAVLLVLGKLLNGGGVLVELRRPSTISAAVSSVHLMQ